MRTYLQFRLPALVLLLALLTGCWDKRELDTLSIVTGVGLDAADAPGQFTISVQLEKSQKPSEGKKQPGGNEQQFYTLDKTGDNLFYAVREMTHVNSRRLFFGHNQIIVLGEDFAKENILPYLDFFLRDHEMRLDVWVLVAEGKAKDIFSTSPNLEISPSIELNSLLQAQSSTSHASKVKLLKFYSDLKSEYVSPIVPVVTIKDDGGQSKVELHGMAVFKNGAMVGMLSNDETRGCLYVRNEINGGIHRLTSVQGRAAIEIKNASSHATPVVKPDGSVVMRVSVEENAVIGEIEGYTDVTMQELYDELTIMTREEIKREIERSLDRAKALGSDYFDFARLIYRSNPDAWESMKDNWPAVFQNLRIDAEVTVKLLGSGKTSRIVDKEDKINEP